MRPAPNVLDRRRISLETGRVEHIISVLELDNTTDTVPDGKVVMRAQVLEGLHETSGHITRLGSLDGGIDQTLSTRHGVEDELGRRQPREERVSHESLRGRFPRLLLEVRERSILESIVDSRSTDNLLSDTGNHLGDVDDRS